MTNSRYLACALLALAAAAPSQAAWKGKGELGVVLARGNADTDTVNAKVEAASESDRWKHGFGLAALRSTNEGDKTAERYGGFWQSDYKFSERTYWFGGLRYEDDRFSGFDYQASATTGLGHKFIDTDATKLSAQGGIGYRRLKNSVTGETSSDPIFGGEVKFEHAFNESTKILNKLVVEAGSDNTFAANDLSLEVKMNASLALSVGLGLRHNTDPPLGREKTDTLTTVNLVYSY
jgi:putative salt-induced outer membrane protein